MRESVSALLIYDDEVFLIKRQNHLKAFPGYFSFPGGKVDKEDNIPSSLSEKYNIESRFINALFRELQEELGFDLRLSENQKIVKDMAYFGEAITPDFNPHRFKNLYIKIFLSKKPKFVEEKGEIADSFWFKSEEAFKLYKESKMLVVPPMISLLKDMADNINSKEVIDPNLKYHGETEVPLIRPVSGIHQFLPLSHTFPPANRTNCFLIGDEKKVLIDPSPQCEMELKKLVTTIEKVVKMDSLALILLSHHHPDHHEFSTHLARDYKLPMGMSHDTHQRILKKYGDDYFKGISIQYFKEGDILCQDNGLDVKVLETPGHDEGQLTLMRSDKAWCILFDLIQTVGTVVVGDEEGDMYKYFMSLRRIINEDPLYIFPSHGIGIGGCYKLEQTLKHRLERESSIHELYCTGLSEEKILEVIYSDIPKRLHPYALKTIRAHLEKIQNHGVG